MCSGPVGFALTNSTCTRRPVGAARPYASPAATTSRSAACSHSSVVKTFRKPGPAISTRSTNGAGGSASTIACATSRGGFPARFASPRATFVAKSPCSFCLGASSSGTGRSPSRPSAGAAADEPLPDPRDELVLDHAASPILRRTRPTSTWGSKGFDRCVDGPERGVLRLVVVADARAQEDDGDLRETGQLRAGGGRPRCRPSRASSCRAARRAGGVASAIASASSPRVALSTTKPSRRKFTSSRRSIAGSSSTSSTRVPSGMDRGYPGVVEARPTGGEGAIARLVVATPP